MTPKAPAARPRPSGGFNSGFGNFQDSFEHLDQNATQAAVQQKQLTQQATNSAQPTTGGQALGTPQQNIPHEPSKPREVGTLSEELIKRPAKDVVAGLASLFDINSLLEISLEKDSPEVQAKKQQTLQRWNKLNQEQQAVAQELYRQEMKKKQQEEEEKQAQAQREQQAKQQSIAVPSSPQKGPVGPGGSHKAKAVQKLEQDRKTLSGPKSSG